MVDLIGPGLGAAVMLVMGSSSWLVRELLSSKGTAKDAEALRVNLDDVKVEHDKRLNGHDADISDIRQNYVSRREFDDKMESSMATITANYLNIKDQLNTHGRWLEFAVFNKKPDSPPIG